MDLQLPPLTSEQALDRAVRNTVGRDICGIAYAKSTGSTAADFGTFAGTMTACFWADIKEKGPALFVQHLHRFLQTDRTLSFEITASSELTVRGDILSMGGV